jgi:hypothetical protein
MNLELIVKSFINVYWVFEIFVKQPFIKNGSTCSDIFVSDIQAIFALSDKL